MRFVSQAGIEVVPFDADMAREAITAWTRFGKGIHSPGLNIGDLAVYALAKRYDLPVLSTSDEFARAGLKPALT